MVEFDQADDKEKIIYDGHWMISYYYLAVSHQLQKFASSEHKIKRIVVWIRFPGLNLIYDDESFLHAMTSAIGRPMKVDINTLRMDC